MSCEDEVHSEYNVDEGQATIVGDILEGASPAGPPNRYVSVSETRRDYVNWNRRVDREISFVPLSRQLFEDAESGLLAIWHTEFLIANLVLKT